MSKASTSDKGKASLEPIVLVDLDPGKKHQGHKTMDTNSGWINGVGHVTYEPIGDYWKSEDNTNRFWLRGIMSDTNNDNQGCSEVGSETQQITWAEVRAHIYRRLEEDPGLQLRYLTPPFI